MIVFDNSGIVPIEAFTTFGMSAKPSSMNPIGKFGTGLKYAVAVTLRLGGTFKLFRGNEEYEFYTLDVDFRGKTFAKVRMRRRKDLFGKWRYEALPFTTELGKHWKAWMAVRELEANCRDEEGVSWHTNSSSVANNAVSDCTRIVVECPEIEEAYNNLNNIFLPVDRVPIYEDDRVRIYEGPSEHIFYRGMRVTDLRKRSLYTYEMKSVFLTEDRTSQYSFLDNLNIMKSLMACNNRKIVDNIVANSEGHHEATFEWDGKSPKVSNAWFPALTRAGITGRFATMRDNLHFGIASDEDVEIELTVAEWERVLAAVLEHGDPVFDKIKKQLTDAGWRETIPAKLEADEVAAAWDAATCCVCGKVVDTREVEEGGDAHGCQLNDKRWVCSSDCYDIALEEIEGAVL